MTAIPLAFRLLRREWRSGEVRLLALALVLAVACVTSVGFLADRVDRALALEARQLLGGDLLLVADHPWPDDVKQEIGRRGLQSATTLTFPSMVSTAAAIQLTDVKAVTAGYPLRGRLRTASALNATDGETHTVPQRGTAWIDERLASALELRVGDPLAVGKHTVRVAAILTYEPDRGVNFFGVAPRLMLNLDDLAATGLVQVGSRVRYHLLVAGGEREVRAFRDWLAPRLARGERMEDGENGRPEIRTAMDRAQRFLGLTTLLTVVLSAVAIALAARRFMQRHLDAFAVMRCLGATQRRLLSLSLSMFSVLGVIASLLGVAIGFGGHLAIEALLGSLIGRTLPAAGWQPALIGLGVGLLLLLGFVLPPLLQLRRVPTLRVLRRELGPPALSMAGAYLLGALGLLGLMFWTAGELRLGAWVAGGFVGALVAFALVTRGLIGTLAPWSERLSGAHGLAVKHGFRALRRRPGAVTVQVVCLAIGFMAIILLTVTRNELIAAWERSVPPDAPNRFIVNIQPDQRDAVARQLADAQLSADLSPMIRGRLTAINGKPVSAEQYADDRARRLVEREFNLSWSDALPVGNRVSAGRWFGPQDAGQGVASVEAGLAQTLGIEIGDELTWTIAGEPLSSRVVGLRKLNWDSMRVNFFVVFPSGVLEAYPKSYITSLHLPAERSDAMRALVGAFPNLTVIDVTVILRQLQRVTDQVIQAVQLLFGFAIVAGLLVLYGALVTVFDERRKELAILRALGARRAQLRDSLRAEFGLVGALAGLVAAFGALAVGQVLARQVFQIDSSPSWWLPPVAALAGALVVVAAGSEAVRRLLDRSPLESLRSAE